MENTSGVPTTVHYNELTDMVLGYVTLVISGIGLLGNIVLFSYLVNTCAWRRLSDTLYLLICVVDLAILPFHVPVSVSLTAQRAAGAWLRSAVGCGIWGIVWNTAMRLSIFFIMVLTVSRMLILLYPFRRIKRTYILPLISVYSLLEATQSALPYLLHYQYYFHPQIVGCDWTWVQVFPFPSHRFYAWFFYRAIFQFAAPFMVIVACCTVSVVSLRRSKRAERYMPHDHFSQSKHCATVTILLLAGTYILCNVPLVIYSTLTFIDTCVSPHEGFHFLEWDSNNYLFLASSVHSVVLNAAVNPLLFCTRVQAVRLWVRNVMQSLSQTNQRPQIAQRPQKITLPAVNYKTTTPC